MKPHPSFFEMTEYQRIFLLLAKGAIGACDLKEARRLLDIAENKEECEKRILAFEAKQKEERKAAYERRKNRKVA